VSIIQFAYVLLVAPTLACGLLGCSSSGNPNDPKAWYNRMMVENLQERTNPPPAEGLVTPTPVRVPPAVPTSAVPVGVVPPTELYRSESSCGAMLPGPGGSAVGPRDMAEDKTECDMMPVADSVPTLDVEQVCQGIAQQGGVTFHDSAFAKEKKDCLDGEHAIRNKLVKQWSSFLGADKTACVNESRAGGESSYTELVTCLEMAREVRNMRGSRRGVGLN
jgi:hypothetical protein